MKRQRLGVVSYLNARPLIQGLDADPRVELLLDVPSRLPDLLDRGVVDAALVPVIDFSVPRRSWNVISDACIASDGETYTVRVFSRVSPHEIRRLHVDGDSHTSVALSRVLWAELHGVDLDIQPFPGRERADECDAILLIGDKVVNHGLVGHEIETDLGSAWKSLTGLPFVFAAWAIPAGRENELLARMLNDARNLGVRSAAMIAEDLGPGMGWPISLARRYLTARLKFHLGARERAAMTRFFDLARQHGVVEAPRELVFA